MENVPTPAIQQTAPETPHISLVHTILARSYTVYFLFSIIALLADTFISVYAPIRGAEVIAVICFAVGPALILWAQHTTLHLKKTHHDNENPFFHNGPYRYLRNPTHLGIVILVAGYTAVSGSIIFLVVTLVGYMISNKFFAQYERVLSSTYGDHYQAYKLKVPKIL